MGQIDVLVQFRRDLGALAGEIPAEEIAATARYPCGEAELLTTPGADDA